mgnify:CR=1 FL=1
MTITSEYYLVQIPDAYHMARNAGLWYTSAKTIDINGQVPILQVKNFTDRKTFSPPTSKDAKIQLALIFLEHFSLGYIKTDPTGCQGKS